MVPAVQLNWFVSFERLMTSYYWCSTIQLNRTFVRLQMHGAGRERLRSSSEDEESDGDNSSEGTVPAVFNDSYLRHNSNRRRATARRSTVVSSGRRPSHRQLRDWFDAYSDVDSSTTAAMDSSSISSITSSSAISDSSSYCRDSSYWLLTSYQWSLCLLHPFCCCTRTHFTSHVQFSSVRKVFLFDAFEYILM